MIKVSGCEWTVDRSTGNILPLTAASLEDMEQELLALTDFLLEEEIHNSMLAAKAISYLEERNQGQLVASRFRDEFARRVLRHVEGKTELRAEYEKLALLVKEAARLSS